LSIYFSRLLAAQLDLSTITVLAVPRLVDLGFGQCAVVVMPRPRFPMITAVIIGPACHRVNCATIQEIARFGL